MKGSCLCGAIEITTPDQKEVGLCHCSMCRRWAGGPMHAVHCGSDVQFQGKTPTTYRSSDWAERGFCPDCGTHLFYHLLPANSYVLPVGLFQEQNFTLATEIFVDEKPAYYALNDSTHRKTGQQVFEQYAPGE